MLNKLRLNETHPYVMSVAWVIINILGILAIDFQFLVPLDKLFNLDPLLDGMIIFMLHSLLAGIFLAMFQMVYISFSPQSRVKRLWALMTFTSIILIFLIDGPFLLTIVIPRLYALIASKISGFGLAIFPLVGLTIYTFSGVITKLITAIIIGLVMGVINSAVIGFCQGITIPNKKEARKWFLAVTISISGGFVINSILFTLLQVESHNDYFLLIRIMADIVIGLAYGIATKTMVVRINDYS